MDCHPAGVLATALSAVIAMISSVVDASEQFLADLDRVGQVAPQMRGHLFFVAVEPVVVGDPLEALGGLAEVPARVAGGVGEGLALRGRPCGRRWPGRGCPRPWPRRARRRRCRRRPRQGRAPTQVQSAHQRSPGATGVGHWKADPSAFECGRRAQGSTGPLRPSPRPAPCGWTSPARTPRGAPSPARRAGSPWRARAAWSPRRPWRSRPWRRRSERRVTLAERDLTGSPRPA